MSINNKIDFTKVSDPKLLVSSKIELNSDTAKGASNAATIIIPNVYALILVILLFCTFISPSLKEITMSARFCISGL